MTSSKVISTGIIVFHKGDRVMYVSGVHGHAENNPLVGSLHECEGTVKGVGKPGMSHRISVEWDNGTTNSYTPKDLMFLSAGKPVAINPNIAFKRKKGGYYHGRR